MTGLVKFDDFFKYVNIFWNSIGVEPYTKPGTSILLSYVKAFVFYLNFIITLYISVCMIFYVVIGVTTGVDPLDLITSMSYISFTFLGFVKMTLVWWKKYAINKLAQDMQNIFPNTLEEQTLCNTKYHLGYFQRLSKNISSLYMFTLWLFNSFAITQYLVLTKIYHQNLPQELPYYLRTTWDWQNHWSYYVLYSMECVAAYASAVGQLGSDLLLLSFVTQLVMHYDNASRALLTYQVNVDQPNMSKEKILSFNLKFLGNVVKYHDYLLKLSDRLNDIFGLSLLTNFFCSTSIICLVGFLLTINASAIVIFRFSLFFTAIVLQAFMICYYGQMLIDSSVNVADAVYNQNWSNADVRYQKMLILMAERAQKPAQLKATTLILISRGTMTDLMQVSYKFFALLRTLYAQK